MTASQCISEYAECPEGDRRCIQAVNDAHPGRSPLHYNRAGFAWDDQEAIESALRVIEQIRADRRAVEVETLRRISGHVYDMAERGGSPALTEALHAVSSSVRRWADEMVADPERALPGGGS